MLRRLPLFAALLLAGLLLVPIRAHAAVLGSEYVAGYCLDANMQTKQFDLWNCHGAYNQNFNFSGYGEVRVGNDCMDFAGEGQPLRLNPCRNTPGQRWGYNQRTHQFNNEQGWCADIKGAAKQRGTPVIAWKCGGQENQKWRIGQVVPLSQASRLRLTGSQLQQMQRMDSLINSRGGNVIAAGGGNVIAAGGGNVIAAGGGNVIAAGGGNVIAAGGGNLIVIDHP